MTTKKLPTLKAGVLVEWPIGKLRADPLNRAVDKAAVAEMAASIRLAGGRILQPLIVRMPDDDERPMIKHGHRRWAGAQLEKLKTVPILLDAVDDDAVNRAMHQVIENVARQDMSSVDVAELLVQLSTAEHKSENELLAELEKRGFKDLGRAKMRDIMKLAALPAWTKKAIRENVLSEAAAGQMLTAIRFPEVLRDLQLWIKDESGFAGRIAENDVRIQVTHLMRSKGVDLNGYHKNEPRAFDLELCKGCPTRVKVGGVDLCMSPAEFEKKQEAGLKLLREAEAERESKARAKARDADRNASAKPSKRGKDYSQPATITPRKVEAIKGGVVKLSSRARDTYERLEGATFDTKVCEGCPHRHLASHDGKKDGAAFVCFLPEHAQILSDAARKTELKVEKVADWLDVRLRGYVSNLLLVGGVGPEARQGLRLWMQADGPIERGYSHIRREHQDGAAREARDKALTRHGITSLQVCVESKGVISGQVDNELLAAAVLRMKQWELRWFAQHVGVSPAVMKTRIDEDYLRMKRRPDLIELARIAGIETIVDLSVADIKTELLKPERVEAIGVPADVDSCFLQPRDERTRDVAEGERFEDDEDCLCIGCGCTDSQACEGGCSWLEQDDDGAKFLGVCSNCPEHRKRFKKGDRALSPAAAERSAMPSDDQIARDMAAAVEHAARHNSSQGRGRE